MIALWLYVWWTLWSCSNGIYNSIQLNAQSFSAENTVSVYFLDIDCMIWHSLLWWTISEIGTAWFNLSVWEINESLYGCIELCVCFYRLTQFLNGFVKCSRALLCIYVYEQFGYIPLIWQLLKSVTREILSRNQIIWMDTHHIKALWHRINYAFLREQNRMSSTHKKQGNKYKINNGNCWPPSRHISFIETHLNCE